jgi:hypothetical protein
MALFSRRHYQALSTTLHNYSSTIYNNECTFSCVVEQLANQLQADNPKFNRQRFLEAIFNAAEIKAWKVQ